MLKQFVPSEFCLKCKLCCRFSQQDSIWSPCLLDEEIQALLDKKDISSTYISSKHRLFLISNPQKQESYICPFLNIADNKCRIYDFRPFECQLYPFLINFRHNKIILTVDLNCPYLREHLNAKESKEYTEYLTAFLNNPGQIKILKNNPHLLINYEEISNNLELKILGELE